VVVAGTGFLGCELASTATKLGCVVTVVTTSAEPMVRPLGLLVAGELRRRLEDAGCRVRARHDGRRRSGGGAVELATAARYPRTS
jgi:NADPH-dependent 2,4-dienoyl-CoA reductase/sulfur reductase-like enzyme